MKTQRKLALAIQQLETSIGSILKDHAKEVLRDGMRLLMLDVSKPRFRVVGTKPTGGAIVERVKQVRHCSKCGSVKHDLRRHGKGGAS